MISRRRELYTFVESVEFTKKKLYLSSGALKEEKMEQINQRIRLTKRLLKESFIELLKEKDIYKISIRELCARAGINHCTFYNHYGNQFDLLKEMEDDVFVYVEKLIGSSSEQSDAFTMLLKYLDENNEMMRLLFNANVDAAFPIKLFSLPIIKRQLNNFFGDGKKEDEANITTFFLYGVYHLIRIWLNQENRCSIEEIEALISDIAMRLNRSV